MNRLMKFIFIVFVIIMIIVAIVNVSKQNKNKNQGQDTAEIKNYKTELRIGISALDNFDPIYSTNKNVQDVSKLIYDSLITLDENYKAKGMLAQEWAKTSETSFIVKLKQGIKFSNGKELIASDIENTINKIKNANSSIYKDNVNNIKDISVIDNYTITFILYENEPFFEYNLIFPIQYSNESETLGTGLYKLYKEYDNKIELARNPYIENAENMKIKSIIIKNYETMGELYNDFKIGNLDIINTDNIEYSTYIGTLGYTEMSFYSRNFMFLAMNLSNSELYNVEVRKAISYAIDKNMIISTIYNNKYYIANFPLDYKHWLYSDTSTSSGYNPDQSRNILEDNGWEYTNYTWQKEDMELNFRLLVSSQDEYRIYTAENIKQQLEDVGINIEIVQVYDVNSYIQNGNYDLALLEMKSGVSPDLSILFGNSNIFNYTNQEAQNIIEDTKNINDDNVLKDRYSKLLEIYKTDIPFISLFFNNSMLIYNSKIAGNITPTWFNLFFNIQNWAIEE